MKTFGVMLFEGFELLDVFGPLEAFGMLANASGAWRDVLLIGFSAVVLIAISTVLLRSSIQMNVWIRAALGFVLGGAFGNLYDRIVNGTVTDFVEVHAAQHYFPAFNVADSAITVGACLLLLDMWLSRSKKLEHAAEASSHR